MQKTPRQILYESQQNNLAYYLTLIFVFAELFMRAEGQYFDIQNPYGLPGALSQMLFYTFGVGFALIMERKREFVFPWSPVAGILWIVGLILASVFALRPGESYPQAVSFAIYLFAGYGIYKASTNERILSYTLKFTALIGVAWMLFILQVFFRNGFSLPYEYIAYRGIKGTFNHHAYGLLIINGGIAIIALISKRKGIANFIVITFTVCLTFFAIFASQARACFVAFVATCAYILLKNENVKGRGQTLVKGAWLILTVLALMWSIKGTSQLNEKVIKRFDFSDQQYQMQKSSGRVEMVQKALILIVNNPLGVGGYNSRYTNVGIAELSRIEGYLLHNQFLTMIAEGGWLVIITLVLIYKHTLVKPFRHKWKSPAALGIFCCWMNYSILCLFADMIGNYYFLMLFMVSAAIALEKRAQEQD